MSLVVGVGHKARHGKGLFCELLMSVFDGRGLRCKKFSFGDEVLKFCKASRLIPRATPRDKLSPEQLRTLQEVGLKQRLLEGEDFWVNRLRDAIASEAPDAAFIDNIRYRNELAWVAAGRGASIKITRLNPDGSEFLCGDRDPKHISEVDLDGARFDFYVINNRDKGWLFGQAVLVASEILQ